MTSKPPVFTRRLLQANLAVSAAITILFIAAPERAAVLTGLAAGPAAPVLVQYFGATHVAFAVLIGCVLRSRERILERAVVVSFFAGDTAGTLVLLSAQLRGSLGTTGWVFVAGSLAFAVSYGWLTFARPRAAQ